MTDELDPSPEESFAIAMLCAAAATGETAGTRALAERIREKFGDVERRRNETLWHTKTKT